MRENYLCLGERPNQKRAPRLRVPQAPPVPAVPLRTIYAHGEYFDVVWDGSLLDTRPELSNTSSNTFPLHQREAS